MSQDDNPDFATPQAGKVAPEAVALRAQPRPVTRLNRRTLAILVGVLSVVSAIVEYAFSVAPALVRMDSSTLLYLSAPALNRDSAPIPASVEFHRALNAVLSPSTALPSIAITSPSE